jgi:hypothetical protein
VEADEGRVGWVGWVVGAREGREQAVTGDLGPGCITLSKEFEMSIDCAPYAKLTNYAVVQSDFCAAVSTAPTHLAAMPHKGAMGGPDS